MTLYKKTSSWGGHDCVLHFKAIHPVVVVVMNVILMGIHLLYQEIWTKALHKQADRLLLWSLELIEELKESSVIMENNSLLHQRYMCLSASMLIHITIQHIFTEIMCFLFCILGSS